MKISVGSDLSKGRSGIAQLRGHDGLSLFLSLVSLDKTVEPIVCPQCGVWTLSVPMGFDRENHLPVLALVHSEYK